MNKHRSNEMEFEESVAERQAEYTRLLTRYRVMQGDRQAYTAESQKLISKQRSEIAALEAEKAELMENLKQAGCVANQKKDERNCEDLANIADNKDWVENQITEQKIMQQELDAKIREVEERINEMKLIIGGRDVFAETSRKLTRRTATLENQLEYMNQKYNRALCKNQEFRTQIDHLRIERARFDLIYKKLDKKLTELRRQNAESIESTTQAFHLREESQARMTALKEKLQKDSVSHNAEMKELIREIDHERKLSEFMNKKAAERKEDPQLVAWKVKKAKEADEKRTAHLETRETYELAFLQMSHLTQEEDFDKILHVFREREDENFALFAYVHELRALQGELTDQMTDLCAKLGEHVDFDKTEEEKNEKLLTALDGCDQKASRKVMSNEQRLRASSGMLEMLMQDVKILFDLVDADRSTLDAKLASSEEVTIFNFIEYLRLVEARMIELIRIANYIALRDSDAPYNVRQCLMGTGPSASAPGPKIISPTLADDFGPPVESQDGVVSCALPMNREDMKAAVMQTVRRKEQEAASRDTIDSVTQASNPAVVESG